jgi:hypothetical protein
MALPDLTGQNIENTYQRVLHTDGTLIWDGTGSLVTLQYTGSFTGDGSGLTGITSSIIAGGNDTEIQFNSGSNFTGNSSFTFNYSELSLQQGDGVSATGRYSHAEGVSTQATGDSSHAEGSRAIATGEGSHAEGARTTATGDGSHAEGVLTQAVGNFSHAEGDNTEAIGDYSHTEGAYTIASGSYQHVQGQYNIASTTDGAFIIGNGKSIINRSNLVFAVDTQFQITGSLLVSGSIDGIINGGTF